MVTALLGVVLWEISAAHAFLIPVCLAALLAFLMSPLVAWLCRHRVPEWLAITVSGILLVLPFLFVGFMLIRQAQSLLQDYPSIIAGLEKVLLRISSSAWGERLGLAQGFTVSALSKHLSDSAGQGIQFLVVGLRTVFEAGTEAVLIFIFAILMLASRTHLRRCSERILAQFESIEAARMLDAVTSLIEQFLIAKVIVVGITATASVLLLSVFGLRYSFLLGVVTGVLTLIPEVGFIASLIPVIIVALSTGYTFLMTVLIVLGCFVIHLLEANVLTPKLVGRKLNLNALATFMGLVAGGLLWGVWGMLLSVPILGVLRIAFSVAPALQPWGELLAEREDTDIARGLMRKRLRRLPVIKTIFREGEIT